MAPRTWKRPLTLMYDNNYKYGTNLYSGAIGDIEAKYLSSMSRTHLPTTRPDVNLSTFAGSNLTSSSTTAATTTRRRETTVEDRSDLRKVRSVGDFDLYRARQDAAWSATLPTIHSRTPFLESSALEDVEERHNRRRRRRREDMAHLDMPTIHMHSHPTPSYGAEREGDKLDAAFWMDKCRHLQSELDSVVKRVAEAESKVQSEGLGAKGKIQQGMNELSLEIEDSSRHNEELQKVIKRQAKHLAELQSFYEEIQRLLMHANEELANSSRRCHNLQTDLDSVRHSVEQVSRSRETLWR